MYTVITRRRVDSDAQEKTRARAQKEFFPKLQAAPGFGGFYLVRDEESGINTAIIVWEDKAHADAFQAEAQSWQRVLDEMGNKLETRDQGETVVSIPPQR